MTKLEQLLSQYAAYHLDHKNVLTHFIGIPLIVFSIMCLSARAGLMLLGFDITLALVLIVFSLIYYLSLDKAFGLLMLLFFVLIYPAAYHISQLDLSIWLTLSLTIFVIGWLFQFVGHFYEKKKPAFVDDLLGLIIGPLFVLAELVFLMGWRKNLQTKILVEARLKRKAMDEKSPQHIPMK